MNIKETFTRLSAEQKRINKEAREAIIEAVKGAKDKTLSLVGNIAYSTSQAADTWMEIPIFGVKLNENDVLVFSTDSCYDDDDCTKEIPSWYRSDTVDECNDYFSVNWLSVLEAVSNAVREEK